MFIFIYLSEIVPWCNYMQYPSTQTQRDKHTDNGAQLFLFWWFSIGVFGHFAIANWSAYEYNVPRRNKETRTQRRRMKETQAKKTIKIIKELVIFINNITSTVLLGICLICCFLWCKQKTHHKIFRMPRHREREASINEQKVRNRNGWCWCCCCSFSVCFGWNKK